MLHQQIDEGLLQGALTPSVCVGIDLQLATHDKQWMQHEAMGEFKSPPPMVQCLRDSRKTQRELINLYTLTQNQGF